MRLRVLRRVGGMIVISLMVVVGGYTVINKLRPVKTVADLAYRSNEKAECIVYVEEKGTYEPYLVLTSDYGGQTLMLRKYLLQDTMPFNVNEMHMWPTNAYGGYYEDSSIDMYLNTEFLDELGESVKNVIVESNIMITDKSSLGVTGDASLVIRRKVFLLSLEELDMENTYTSVPEGKPLKYFVDDYNRRTTQMSNGEKCAYWTRTPETWETYTVFTIGRRGIGAGAADIDSGVRPAFCVQTSTKVIPKNDIVANQTVYVLE